MDSIHLGLWILFLVLVVTALAVDLGLKSHRHRVKPVSLKEATIWSVVWVALALVFAGVIARFLGAERAMEYLTAYALEKSLSVDNMFVFVVIFQYFHIPPSYQHRVLKWGILGAIVMRFVLIFTGVALVNKFHWLLYGFGAILLYTAYKLLHESAEEVHPENNPALKLLKRWLPITHEFDENRFLTVRNGIRMATPMLAAVVVVEASDLLFAVDSIPAVLVISKDPFIVFTSNVFAILGLRALYFLISGVLTMFRFLRYGLAVVLAFIGVKMLIVGAYKIPVAVSLSVVAAVLAISIVASMLIKDQGPPNPPA